MPAYVPGQGMSGAAVERLRARKGADAVALPAADASQQWDRVLGGQPGAKKKPRCSNCTRPLSDQELERGSLVCARCDGEARAAAEAADLPLYLAGAQAGLANDELGPAVFAFICRATASSGSTSRPRSAAPAADETSVVGGAAGSGAVARGAGASGAATAGQGASSASTAALRRGAPVSAAAAGTTVPEDSLPLSILSFSALADCLVARRRPGEEEASESQRGLRRFPYCDDALLAWEARLPQILEAVSASSADVVCLQEVMLEQRDDGDWVLPAWAERLEGYTGVLPPLSQKEWMKLAERNRHVLGAEVPVTVVTFFKSARFEECAAAKHSAGVSALTLFLRCRDVPTSKIGAFAGADFDVAVTNVRAGGERRRPEDPLKVLNTLKKTLAKQDNRVLCGDFNCEIEPGGEVARWLDREGFWEVPTGTSWAEPGQALRLDHIFHSPGLQVLAASAALSEEEVASGLPCASCPSDHAPVAALLAGAPRPVRSKCPW
eukprot:TRINITY_DN1572_c0_g1_i1.p1 TRINITY_DN1572_c0_g1~~TRINITY_DN1572_c0_g1_i1.p1  ORF type:complete len:496 (+),score=123.44 TRINITY_DN1572_c0_g1_i1:237-1724(+)